MKGVMEISSIGRGRLWALLAGTARLHIVARGFDSRDLFKQARINQKTLLATCLPKVSCG